MTLQLDHESKLTLCPSPVSPTQKQNVLAEDAVECAELLDTPGRVAQWALGLRAHWRRGLGSCRQKGALGGRLAVLVSGLLGRRAGVRDLGVKGTPSGLGRRLHILCSVLRIVRGGLGGDVQVAERAASFGRRSRCLVGSSRSGGRLRLCVPGLWHCWDGRVPWRHFHGLLGGHLPRKWAHTRRHDAGRPTDPRPPSERRLQMPKPFAERIASCTRWNNISKYREWPRDHGQTCEGSFSPGPWKRRFPHPFCVADVLLARAERQLDNVAALSGRHRYQRTLGQSW